MKVSEWFVEVQSLGSRGWKRVDSASTLRVAQELMLGAEAVAVLHQGDIVRVSDGLETRRLAVMTSDRGILEVAPQARTDETWPSLWRSLTHPLGLAVPKLVDVRRVALAAARVAALAVPIVEGDGGVVRDAVELTSAWAKGGAPRWGTDIDRRSVLRAGKAALRFAEYADEIDDAVASAARAAAGATETLGEKKSHPFARSGDWASLIRLAAVVGDTEAAIYASAGDVIVSKAIETTTRAQVRMSEIIIHEIPLAAVLLGIHGEQLPFNPARDNPAAKGFSVAPLTPAEAAELRVAIAARRRRNKKPGR